MHAAPSVPLYVWCVAAIAVTAIFWAFFVPLMPNKQYRLRIASAPLAGVVFVALASVAKDDGPEVALPIYSCVVLGIVLGFVGRRTELKEKSLNMARNGEGKENALSAGLQLQLVLVIVVMAAVGTWFSMPR